MSTQNKQTSSTSFDPTSMGVFQGFQPQYSQAMSSEVTDPYSNMFFNKQLGMQNQSIATGNQNNMEALLQRAKALGINPNSPAYFSQLNQLQRQMQSQRAGGFNDLLLQAGQFRQNALQNMGGYRPLVTGGTQTQQQSGLGTWLPQLAGAAIKGGMAMATGGASMAGDAASSGSSGGGSMFFPGTQSPGGQGSYIDPMSGFSGSSGFNPFMPTGK